jgi:hypothetical protein
MDENPRPRRKAPNELFADSLELLQPVLDDGIYKSEGIRRRDFVRLHKAGYLVEIIRGWYHVSSPFAHSGSTVWQGHFWPFLRQYLQDRFGENYCLSVQSSLLIHAGLTKIPDQTIVLIDRHHGQRIELPFGSSLLAYEEKSGLPAQVEVVRGVRVMTPVSALARAPEGFFKAHPVEAASLLMTLTDSADLVRRLVEAGSPIFGGRLAGAYRHIGNEAYANRILLSLRSSGREAVESNPFDSPIPSLGRQRIKSPYVARIRLMWQSMRRPILERFGDDPGLPVDINNYLARLEQVSRLDAYHSLSIEGYRVDAALIARVRTGGFDPKKLNQDRQQRDALAAKGYYDASLKVRSSIERILRGARAADVLQPDHHDWYHAMFAVTVEAGLHDQSELAGYRGHQVYISNSEHVPLPTDSVVDAMECLFELLSSEPSAAVRAILGHFIFVFINPYSDGNGRMGRFLMNALFASGGFPWTIVHLDVRDRYMKALERASTEGIIDDFANVIADEMERTQNEEF